MALSKITIDSNAKADIFNAVNAGKVVTAHEAKINFNGWIGEGYTLIDPQTGAGGYIISGGGNGGELTDKDLGALSAVFGLVGLAGVVVGAAFFPLLAAVILPFIAFFAAFAVIGLATYAIEGGVFDWCAGFKAMVYTLGFFGTGAIVFGLTVTGLTSLMKGYLWWGGASGAAACALI
ncbi:MAG: hypothetical protein V4660_03600 [Pseudomonadota bacterium]